MASGPPNPMAIITAPAVCAQVGVLVKRAAPLRVVHHAEREQQLVGDRRRRHGAVAGSDGAGRSSSQARLELRDLSGECGIFFRERAVAGVCSAGGSPF